MDDDKRFHDVTTFHRSSVHILLADRDAHTRREVFELLRRCSYKVTAVESAKHVLEVLRAGGPAVDVILLEVEFPHGKGLKLLKHIMREDKLKQIPVVMMSQRDEMALVVKSLRLGAADYLVKPLRTNELLNLWTHMWRRRRMLGMTDRLSGYPNMNGPPWDLAFSDTSDSNSGSVDMLSNETAGERRTRLEGQVNEDNERDEMRSHMSPVLSLSLKPSSDGVEIKAQSGYEMLPPTRKPSQGSSFRTPPAPLPGTFGQGHNNAKRLRANADLDSSAKVPDQTTGESYAPPPQHTTQVRTYIPSSAWHQSAPSGSSAAPPLHVSNSEGGPSWPAPGHNLHPPPEFYGQHMGIGVHPHSQRMQQRTAAQGEGRNSMGRRLEGSPPKDPARLQHAGGSSNVGTASPPQDFQRPPSQGEGRRANEAQKPQEGGPWQNAFRPPFFSEPPFGGMVSVGGPMPNLPPHFFMHPGAQGVPRDPSNPPGGGQRDHSPPTAHEDRSQGFSEAPPGPFGLPSGMPMPPNGMPMPPELLMNPHLAMFNIPPGVMPLSLPPGMPPQLAAGLIGQMQFPPFFQNMLNPHMIRPPASVPTPPPQASKPPQARAVRYSPSPPTTGGQVSGLPVGPQQPPAPMWPVLQAGGERKMDQAERREAALSKFRQKRKDRCFAKKIRYASRKKLAEARPRIKGQFVRQKGGQEEEELEEEEEEEEDEMDDEDMDEESKGAQLPDISSSLNGSGDSRSALNTGSR